MTNGQVEICAKADSLLAHAAAPWRQTNPNLSFILRIALPDNVSHGLHPLPQRGKRARIQEQFVAEAADGLMVVIIQSNQHEVLGIS